MKPPGYRHFNRMPIALKIEPRSVGNDSPVFFVTRIVRQLDAGADEFEFAQVVETRSYEIGRIPIFFTRAL